jgi:hypothetical protein
MSNWEILASLMVVYILIPAGITLLAFGVVWIISRITR